MRFQIKILIAFLALVMLAGQQASAQEQPIGQDTLQADTAKVSFLKRVFPFLRKKNAGNDSFLPEEERALQLDNGRLTKHPDPEKILKF